MEHLEVIRVAYVKPYFEYQQEYFSECFFPV